MTVRTIGATENFVARPRPTISPASSESSLRPDWATRMEKNTPATMNKVITPSTAKKWLNWMCMTANAASKAATTPTRKPNQRTPMRKRSATVAVSANAEMARPGILRSNRSRSVAGDSAAWTVLRT